MTHSMTAYASRTGSYGSRSWVWDMRGVNARGLDIRLRLPEGLDAVDVALRKAIKAQLNRGSITVSLRMTQTEGEGDLAIDETALDSVLTALDRIQDRAFALGVTLGQPTAADVLLHRGVLRQTQPTDETAGLMEALLADVEPLMAEFVAMRAQEGASLQGILADQIGQIEALVANAKAAAATRRAAQADRFKTAVVSLMSEAAELDEGRIEQEMAMLAVKQDITEELDRLSAHVDAATMMLNDSQPMGRKLDFLSQEFNREANTLCAKSQNTALTAIGLDLKTVVDQMREQVQNVE